MSDEHSDWQASPGQSRAYCCPQCGADMRYDAASQAMVCGHCGHEQAVPTIDGHRAIVDYDLEQGLAQSRERGYGTRVHTTQCRECGAAVSFSAGSTAATCDFCGSPQVLHRDRNHRVLRPEGMIPFRVPREVAGRTFAAWLGKLWFRPRDLRRRARVTDMSGVYIPYWSFGATVHSDWLAMAGYHYYETEPYRVADAGGKVVTRTRHVQRTRWRPAWGTRVDRFDDVLVCASLGLPEPLGRKLRTFDTSALVPYDPSFLAGWRAEEYGLELNDGWRRAVRRMEAVQRRRCASDVPGDTHGALYVTNRFSSETFKHILLPVWISSYRYRDRIYRFLVNGQTGEITGAAPLSRIKIVAFVALVGAVVAAIAILFAMYR